MTAPRRSMLKDVLNLTDSFVNNKELWNPDQITTLLVPGLPGTFISTSRGLGAGVME